jgi:hypothetical protein
VSIQVDPAHLRRFADRIDANRNGALADMQDYARAHCLNFAGLDGTLNVAEPALRGIGEAMLELCAAARNGLGQTAADLRTSANDYDRADWTAAETIWSVQPQWEVPYGHRETDVTTGSSRPGHGAVVALMAPAYQPENQEARQDAGPTFAPNVTHLGDRAAFPQGLDWHYVDFKNRRRWGIGLCRSRHTPNSHTEVRGVPSPELGPRLEPPCLCRPAMLADERVPVVGSVSASTTSWRCWWAGAMYAGPGCGSTSGDGKYCRDTVVARLGRVSQRGAVAGNPRMAIAAGLKPGAEPSTGGPSPPCCPWRQRYLCLLRTYCCSDSLGRCRGAWPAHQLSCRAQQLWA